MRQFSVPAVPRLYLPGAYVYVVAVPPVVGVGVKVPAVTIPPVAVRVVEICTVTEVLISDADGAVPPVPPENEIVGADVYPEPPLVIVTPVILPLDIVAVPVAVTPPVCCGAENAGVGADVYPEPIPEPVIVTDITGPESVTIPVYCAHFIISASDMPPEGDQNFLAVVDAPVGALAPVSIDQFLYSAEGSLTVEPDVKA